jgi:PDDEXK-like domain of unknown function (DUF3799)
MLTVEHQARMADGIYLGLPDRVYHGALALSSHGVRHLQVSTLDYWMHCAALNPEYEDLATREDTEAKQIGVAFDCRIIEGHAEFDRRFAAALDPREYPEAVRTNDEIVARIIDAGGPTRGYSGKRKEELIRILAEWAPQTPIWETLVRSHQMANEGKVMLPPEIVRRIEIASAMIWNHPDLCKAFTGGVPKPCVFWEDPATGVPCKAQFDYWKPRALVDLKSYATLDMPLDRAIARAFVRYRYDIQCAFYLRAWEQAKRLIAKGLVFGPYDPVLFEQLAEAPDITFLFVWQSKGMAPVAKGKALPANSGTIYIANSEIETAITSWARCWETHGPDPWIQIDPIETWDDSDFPFSYR